MKRIGALRGVVSRKTRGVGIIAAARHHGKTFIGTIFLDERSCRVPLRLEVQLLIEPFQISRAGRDYLGGHNLWNVVGVQLQNGSFDRLV